MAAITRTKANVRPLAGAIIRRGEAGGTIQAGELVYLDGANGFKVGDGSLAASAAIRGMMVAPEDAVDGDQIDVCVFGPVEGFESMVPGALHYVSDTDGELDTAAGTKSHIAGWAASASTFFVNIAMPADPA